MRKGKRKSGPTALYFSQHFTRTRDSITLPTCPKIVQNGFITLIHTDFREWRFLAWPANSDWIQSSSSVFRLTFLARLINGFYGWVYSHYVTRQTDEARLLSSANTTFSWFTRAVGIRLGYEVWICFQGIKFIPFPWFTWATCTHWWNHFGLGLAIAPPKCSENTLYLEKILNIFYTWLPKLFFLNNIMAPREKKFLVSPLDARVPAYSAFVNGIH